MYGMSKAPWCVGPSGPVRPARSRREGDRQVLQGHLLEDLIERALQEGRVDVHDGPHARLGQCRRRRRRRATRRCRCRRSGREVGAHLFQLVALAHGRRDDRDVRVVLHGVVDGAADGVGVGARAAALERQDRPLGADLLEDRRRVVRHRVGAGLRDAVALLGQDVQQHRAFLVLDVAQPAAQRRQVVAVDRAEVAEAQLLEQHAAGQERLQAVLDLLDGLRGHAADERNAVAAGRGCAVWSPGRSSSAGPGRDTGPGRRRAGRWTSRCR